MPDEEWAGNEVAYSVFFTNNRTTVLTFLLWTAQQAVLSLS